MRLGAGINAAGLFLYAAVPVVLGMIARVRFPDLASPELALPTLLSRGVPPFIGTLGTVPDREVCTSIDGQFTVSAQNEADVGVEGVGEGFGVLTNHYAEPTDENGVDRLPC